MPDHPLRRSVFTLIGLVLIALGIAITTLAGIGTTPLAGPVWVLALTGHLTFGTWTMMLNVILFVMQIVLLRRDFPKVAWLQIPAAFVMSSMVDVWMWTFGWLQPTDYLWQFVQLVAGTVVLGLGIALMVVPDLLQLPGEGILVAIRKVWGWPFHTLKIIFDVSMVILSVAMAFAFFGELRGLREGTAVSALLVGPVVGFVMPTVRRMLDRWLSSAPSRT